MILISILHIIWFVRLRTIPAEVVSALYINLLLGILIVISTLQIVFICVGILNIENIPKRIRKKTGVEVAVNRILKKLIAISILQTVLYLTGIFFIPKT